MIKENEWYDLWAKQSKEFFDTANKNLQKIFDKKANLDPEEHMQEINRWLETLKDHWRMTDCGSEQQKHQEYWSMMTKMCTEASDKMIQEWIKRSKNENPITSIRELYELWLTCCQEVYQRSLQSKAYQEVYGNFMNAALKFWKSTIPQ